MVRLSLLPLVCVVGCSDAEGPIVAEIADTYIALCGFDDTHGHLPTNILSPKGEKLVSWRFRLSPYLSPPSVPLEIHEGKPWNSKEYAHWRTFRQAGVSSDEYEASMLTVSNGDTALGGEVERSLSSAAKGLGLFFYWSDSGISWIEPRDVELQAEGAIGSALGQTWIYACLVDGRIIKLKGEMPAESFKEFFSWTTTEARLSKLLSQWAVVLRDVP